MRTRAMVLLGVLLLGASAAGGAVVEVPLDCAGHYEWFDTWTGQFDLGLEFSRIDNAYVDWSGEITGELVEELGSGEQFPLDTQFVLTLYKVGPENAFGEAHVTAGKAMYPDPEPFSEQTAFDYLEIQHLLDGQAKVEVRLRLSPRWAVVTTEEFPSGEMLSATLVIEGAIVVPEPVSIVMLTYGVGCGLLRRRPVRRGSLLRLPERL